LLIYIQQAKGCGIAAITPLKPCARAGGGVKAESPNCCRVEFRNDHSPQIFQEIMHNDEKIPVFICTFARFRII